MWLYCKNKKVYGPIDEPQLIEKIQSGYIGPFDLIALSEQRQDDKEWRAVVEHENLKPHISKSLSWEDEQWVLLKSKNGEYRQSGPFSSKKIQEMINHGKADSGDFIWRPGFKEWLPIHFINDFSIKEQNLEEKNKHNLLSQKSLKEIYQFSQEQLLSHVLGATEVVDNKARKIEEIKDVRIEGPVEHKSELEAAIAGNESELESLDDHEPKFTKEYFAEKISYLSGQMSPYWKYILLAMAYLILGVVFFRLLLRFVN